MFKIFMYAPNEGEGNPIILDLNSFEAGSASVVNELCSRQRSTATFLHIHFALLSLLLSPTLNPKIQILLIWMEVFSTFLPKKIKICIAMSTQLVAPIKKVNNLLDLLHKNIIPWISILILIYFCPDWNNSNFTCLKSQS